MTGRLTIQRFHEDESARIRGQVEMRSRISKWMRTAAGKCLDDKDTIAFAKLYFAMADEIETLEPR